MTKLDPKVRGVDITYNYLPEKSTLLPNWVVFLPSAKHASVYSLASENFYKSNTYQIIYALELNLGNPERWYLCTILRQEWAKKRNSPWTALKNRVSFVYVFWGDVIVSLVTGTVPAVVIGLAWSSDGLHLSPGPFMNNSPFVRLWTQAFLLVKGGAVTWRAWGLKFSHQPSYKRAVTTKAKSYSWGQPLARHWECKGDDPDRHGR